MKQPVIVEIKSVRKQFDKHTIPAVQNITLTLGQSDILGLLGPSGCGKTTLLRLVAGFEVPDAGAIAIAGRLVAGESYWVPPEKRDAGIVFQDYALFPHLTVAQNVGFGLKRRPNAKQHLKEAIALVGLEGLEKRYPHQLSGGQQQRVALARALAPQPAVILLDEPLSNLDVQVRLRLREEIRKILKASGTSGIFVTHDCEEALCVSDYLGVMRQGELEQLGTPEEVYSQPATRFVAEFVTQANFLPAHRRGQLWETEVGCFEVSDRLSPECDRGEVTIREEDLILKPDDTGSAVIRDRQFLGREHRYYLVTPSGKELHARTTTTNLLPVGTRVSLAVKTTRVFGDRRTED